MQKNMFKALGVFTLALFVMSMTGAATCTPCTANPDAFNFNSTKHCGSVLSNDNGTGIKVVNVSKTTNGGKVSMSKNGNFCYKPAHCSKTIINDSFTYTIENKCGKKSTGKVTINYKCH
jgi:Bacterial Ig domain